MKMTLEDFKSNYVKEATKIKEKEKYELVNDKLEEMNSILFDELKRLEKVSNERPNEAQLEINRSNAMSNIGKTILQTAAAQIQLGRLTK